MFKSKIEKVSKPDSFDEFEELVVKNKIKDIVGAKLKTHLPYKKTESLLKKKTLAYKNGFEEVLENLLNLKSNYVTTDCDVTLGWMNNIMNTNLFDSFNKFYDRFKEKKILNKRNIIIIYILYQKKRFYS